MFEPYRNNTKFGPALRAISIYANAFDADGNGWVEESINTITFRITLAASSEDSEAQLAMLEQRLKDRDLRIALGITYRRREPADGELRTDIFVSPLRLTLFVNALRPASQTAARNGYYDISGVRT
jgi:hypothetical protein